MVYDNRPNLKNLLAAILLENAKDLSGDSTENLTDVLGLPMLPPGNRGIIFWDTVNRIKELNAKEQTNAKR